MTNESQPDDGLARRVWRRIAPRRVRQLRARALVARHRGKFHGMGVEDAFMRVYEEGWWGGSPEFDSGEGSTESRLTDPYVEIVRRFIEEHRIRSVVDLGCGDFMVGRQLIAPRLQYTGLDIVQDLVDRNIRLFAAENVSFAHANLIEGDLPPAELGLLRQVLQHLSNAQVQAVLDNCRGYRYLLVTEHVCTADDISPNLDIPHGPDTRINDNSSILLEHPPFSRQVKVLLEVPYAENEVLRTMLIEHPV